MKITKAMLARYESGRTRLNDPCVICGGEFGECHTVEMTAAAIKQMKRLTAKQRTAIIREETP